MRSLAGLPSWLRLLIGGGVIGLVAVAIAVIVLVASATNAAYEQPIAFKHSVHAGDFGIPCQYCHVGVAKGPAATIPSVEKCAGCHESGVTPELVSADGDEIAKLLDYWQRQEPIPWKRINVQPSYVHFNHSSHIAAGVGCGSCHGDIASMDRVEPAALMNMGFCLDCHAQQENKDALWDCAVCHY